MLIFATRIWIRVPKVPNRFGTGFGTAGRLVHSLGGFTFCRLASFPNLFVMKTGMLVIRKNAPSAKRQEDFSWAYYFD